MSLKLFKMRPMVVWMIIIPMILAVIYYVAFASSRYLSHSQVVVRQAESGQQASVPGLALLMGSVDPASREYTLYLREHVLSHDMLQHLESELDWTAHYASQTSDPLYWLDAEAPLEERLKYYRRTVEATYDDTTGLLTIDVQAFEPEFARQVLQEILKSSEVFVNDISRGMANEQLEFARRELTASTERYEDSKKLMLDFQNRYNVLDAEATAVSMVGIVSTLEAEIAKENANLKALVSSLAPEAPQIRAQRTKINALEDQLEFEKKRITSIGVLDDPLNALASEYRKLQVDATVAEEFYATSLAVVENAKLEATKNVRNLVQVVAPNLPEDVSYPRVIYNLITIFIVLCLLFGISRFVIASIEDHRE